jgi:RNA polymerase sigma-70 factor (ECF subfamily)
MDALNPLVTRAAAGDLDAFAEVVRDADDGVCRREGGRRPGAAQDAAQEAYLAAFRRLADLDEPAAFAGWLRRIVINAALNARRARRHTFLQLDDASEVPVLDEAETRWTDAQRQRLASALVSLSSEERRLCDRRYHGGWSVARLAGAGVEESAMRKRLQRIRDKLRKEMEMSERRAIGSDDMPGDLPDRIVELLARPQLTELPENPVGKILELLRGVYAGFSDIQLPEVVDWREAERTIAADAVYIEGHELQRIDEGRILRYDLTLPLLMHVRFRGDPIRMFSSGKSYRVCQPDRTHLEAFHQAEVFCLDRRDRLDMWRLRAVSSSVDDDARVARAFADEVSDALRRGRRWEHGRWCKARRAGVFTDRVAALAATPHRPRLGVGYA